MKRRVIGIESNVKEKINVSYMLENNTIATRFKNINEMSKLFDSNAGCYLANSNCLDELCAIPKNSIKLDGLEFLPPRAGERSMG